MAPALHSSFTTIKTMILARHLQNTNPWLNELSRFFDHSFQRTGAGPERLRFLADDSGWTLQLDLPGVKRDAVTLESKDQELKLAINHEGAFPVKLRYQLPLAKQVDATAIAASLADGVLSVRLPKKAAAEESNRIEIL
ncbi:MAG: small heat shock protein-like protein [Akkermansiaceae bacterium]|nr:small heat shock protein-like protein [Akkermansiaceae bacterium]